MLHFCLYTWNIMRTHFYYLGRFIQHSAGMPYEGSRLVSEFVVDELPYSIAFMVRQSEYRIVR